MTDMTPVAPAKPKPRPRPQVMRLTDAAAFNYPGMVQLSISRAWDLGGKSKEDEHGHGHGHAH